MEQDLEKTRKRIKELRQKRGYSYQDLADLTGFSKSVLQRYETGETDKLPLSRLMTIAEALKCTPAYLMGWENSTNSLEYQPDDLTPYNPTKRIPILGYISAGLPLYAEEHIEGYTITDLNGGHEYFALRVQGDSMNAARIFDKDILIVRKQNFVENGEIAVVMVNGENATVKRFYKEGTTVTLMPQSTNPAHVPQIYNTQSTEIKVIGKVVESKINFA